MTEEPPEPLTAETAFAAMTDFLHEYASRAGDDLITLLSGITIEPDGITSDPAAWEDWLDSVRHIQSGHAPRSAFR